MPLNQYSYQEYPRERGRVRIKKRKGAFLKLLLWCVLLTLLVILVRSPLFKLETIDLTGNERVSTGEVLAVINLQPGITLWEISPSLIKARLGKIALIDSFELNYIFPRGIALELVEKVPVALMPYQGRYLEISRDGTILGLVDHLIPGMPLLTGRTPRHPYIGQDILDAHNPSLEEFLKAVSLLPEHYLSLYSDFKISDPQNLVAYTLEGIEIWLGSGDFPSKIQKVPEVIVEIREQGLEPDYIDLRVSHFLSDSY